MNGGVWFLPDPQGEGTLVVNAHDVHYCSGVCPLHSPSDHWARAMTMRWIHDTSGGRMERRCPHGHWHDDPDDLEYRLNAGAQIQVFRSCPCDCPCECPRNQNR